MCEEVEGDMLLFLTGQEVGMLRKPSTCSAWPVSSVIQLNCKND
jgi:hypothetical protein